MPRHRASRSLRRWARRILPLAMVSVAAVVLWAAALSTAWRHEHSPDWVIVGPGTPVVDGP